MLRRKYDPDPITIQHEWQSRPNRNPVYTDRWPGGGAGLWVQWLAGLVSRVGLQGGGARVLVYWLAVFVRAAAMLGGSGIIKVATK